MDNTPLNIQEPGARELQRARWVRIGGAIGVGLVVAGAAVGIIVAVTKKGSSGGGGSFDPKTCDSYIAFCNKTVVPQGATDCKAATCATCNPGRSTVVTDTAGPYCALDCAKTLNFCAKAQTMPRDATTCATAACQECSAGADFALDQMTLETLSTCAFTCTNDQLLAGCAPGSCTSAKSCSKCVPGFTASASRTLRGADVEETTGCTKAAAPQALHFFMYRAQNDAYYPPENVDLGSADGVMWYLHNEVVNVGCQCPPSPAACTSKQRHYGITRVLRFNVTMMNTQQVFQTRAGQFGHFYTFDSGRCSNPECDGQWKKYGYTVGCQPLKADNYNGAWYSLPGWCPSLAYNDPNKKNCVVQGVAQNEPGGQCASPDGTDTCTWNATLVDWVTLDELEGIKDYQAFCASGGVEFSLQQDKGTGCTFWDDKENAQRNKERVLALQRAFAKKTPGLHSYSVPDPICDGF